MHDVFISYNRNDSVHAEHLAEALRALDLSVFFDKRFLLPGSRWRPELENALRESHAVAVLLGPAGIGETQSLEQEFALAERERAPIVSAALTWVRNSFGRFSTEIIAELSMLRVFSASPSRPRTAPQQYSVTRS